MVYRCPRNRILVCLAVCWPGIAHVRDCTVSALGENDQLFVIKYRKSRRAMKYHMSVSSQLATSTEFEGERGGIVPLVEHSLPADVNFPSLYQGPRRGRGRGGLQPPPPHFFGNFKELLRKGCFQPPHFESLVSPPTFKVAPRALRIEEVLTCAGMP